MSICPFTSCDPDLDIGHMTDAEMLLIGDNDVSASPAHAAMDRKGHRAAFERGVHMAEPVQRI